MPASDETVIQLNGAPGQPGLLEQRAVLLPLLQPQNQEEEAKLNRLLAELADRAAADQHPVLRPTHIMLKAGRMIGYLSLGALPTVHAWFDSQHRHVLDSLKMIEHGETVFRTQGVRDFTIACADASPFAPHLERLGFTKLGVTTLWRKEL